MSTLHDALAKAKAARRKLNPGVTELTDMVVNEVSLVDRAANLRTFVVVKRAADENSRAFTALYKAALGAAELPGAIAKSRASSALLKYGDSVRPEERAVLAKMAGSR